MIIRKWVFDLDVKNKTKIPKITLVEGDTNGNAFEVHLKNLDTGLEDSYVTFTFLKEDGNVVVGNASVLNASEGIVFYLFKGNELSCPGVVLATIEVYNQDGISRFTTPQFKFNVVEQLDNGDAIESTSEYHVLTELISDVEAIKLAEQGRVEAEEIREIKEAQRQANIAQAIQNALEATERANNFASLAENNANLAEEKANLAQSKAELAQEKADLADLKAQEASHAIDSINALEDVVRANEQARQEAEQSREMAEQARENAFNQALGDFDNVSSQKLNKFDEDATNALSEFDTNSKKAINDFIEETERVESLYPEKLKQHELKMAKVEKELNDYKATMQRININQEPKQKATGYGMVSLPKNAANGQVSATLKGLTATNLIKNGNFRDGTSGWQLNYITNVVVNNEEVSFVATKQWGGIRQGNSKVNNRYYLCALVKSISPDVRLILRNGATVAHSGSGNYEKLSLVATVTAEPLTDAAFGVEDFGTTFDTVYVKYVMAINLTAMGLEHLTKEECDQIFANWFDGTKSTVGATRLKSVGKNLIQPTLDGWIKQKEGILIIENGVFSYQRTSPANHDRIYKLFKVKPNTTYSASMNILTLREGYSVDVVIKDGNISGKELTFFREYSTGVKKRTFTTLSDTICVILYGDATGVYYSFKDFQIEEGAVATPYEPYKESNAYVIATDKDTGKILELRSLPNGTKDEVRVSEGKAIINTKKHILQTSDINYLFLEQEVDVVRILLPTDCKDVVDSIQSVIYGDRKFIPYTSRLDVSNVGAYSLLKAQGYNFLFLTVAKGTYATLAEAQSDLAGTELIYQLAEPVEIPIQVSGTLTSYPNGTIYIERILPDADVYTDKITILHQDAPIKRLDKLSKVDFMTGVETELDINQAKISEDKLSFTHPELSAGDIVFFEYEYDVESTEGEAEVEFYDSRYVVKDTETGKFYKWNIVVANGQPSIKLVEV